MSILVSGTVSSPICKAMKIAPEKNAQVVHAVSSPVVTLIPFSAMGAFQVGYLGNMAVEVGGSPNIYYESLPFFFTQLIFVFGTLLVILTGLDFPLMKQKMAEYREADDRRAGADGAGRRAQRQGELFDCPYGSPGGSDADPYGGFRQG